MFVCRLSKKCLPFVDKVHLQAEFVKVECTITNSNSSSVVDFHFTIPSNSKSSRTDGTFDDLPSTVMSENQKDRPFSVIMLGLDAVSRLNFERHLIQTRKFLLETLNAVELYGYNKVGDNTFPNLVPVLSGLSEPELSNLCWTNHNQPFDTCPWIWKKFKSQGYITMYGEDSTDISTFNYQKQGFRKKPTDFYLRPFLRAAEPSIGAVLSLNTHLCLGPRPLYQVTLEWAHQFMKTFSDQSYFGLVWSNSLTHDNEDFIQRADPFLHSMLHDLHVSKKLEDTFVILLSDHGIRWGALRETLIGRYEERLPMLYIIPPRRFRHNYPEAYENLQANSRRLTSPFDLYETLISILSLQENSTALSDFTSTYASRGSSLFKKISESRSCQNAGINPHWCACHETITLNVDIPEVVSTAYFIVSAINNITAPFADRCAVFQLDQVLGARRITNLQMHEGSLDDFYYVVTLRTFPGNAVFEATVRTSRNTSVVEGDISRVNLYSGTSECVSDSVIRKFCSCNS